MSGQAVVGGEYLLVQRLQDGTGLGAEFIDEDPAGVLIGGQRRALAAAPGQGQH